MFRLKKDMVGVAVWDNPDPNDVTTKAVDVLRPIKVIVIGAGMSGMTAGILFPRSIENLELVIYEKNADIGGTWFENRYYRNNLILLAFWSDSAGILGWHAIFLPTHINSLLRRTLNGAVTTLVGQRYRRI